MKDHKKYAKLPQDLDLSFQEQLDAVDTAVADDFNLSGSGLDEDDDNILDDQEDEEDDEDEDEIVIASAVAAAASLTGSGVRLASATAAARKQQLNRKVLAGLGRDSVIEVSLKMFLDNIKKILYVVGTRAVKNFNQFELQSNCFQPN